jgi:23S rRNA pseudouridine2457 synthase
MKSDCILFFKPYEVLSQFSPVEGRLTLKNFIDRPGIYPAGRLDYRSEGLLILSNDGWLIQRLTDPRFEHSKTYLVQVEGLLNQPALDSLRHTILLEDQTRLPLSVREVNQPPLPDRSKAVRNYHPTSWIEIVLMEGKKHQVRRMTAAAGFPTLRLVRSAIGSLKLDDLQPGEWRALTGSEIQRLKNELGW